MDTLLNVPKDSLVRILGEIANKANIDSGSPMTTRTLSLERFLTPSYPLPPSFHEAIFEYSWRAQDIYREKMTRQRNNVELEF